MTRSAISYTLEYCQSVAKAKLCHWEVVLCIVRYIKEALGKGLLYMKKMDIKVKVYIDADYVVTYITGDLFQHFALMLVKIQSYGTARNKR